MRPFQDPRDDRLMPSVKPVEIPDGRHRGAKVGAQGSEVAEDLHEVFLRDATAPKVLMRNARLRA